MSDQRPRPLNVELDTAVYRLSAIKKAAYRMGDRCHIEIRVDSPKTVVVSLRPKRLLDNAEFLADEFRKEALDQELREMVAGETEAVRNLLLAQAFAATSLLEPLTETADYRDDPLGVGRADRQAEPNDSPTKTAPKAS